MKFWVIQGATLGGRSAALPGEIRCQQVDGRIGLKIDLATQPTADADDIAAGVLGGRPSKTELKTLNAVGKGTGDLHTTRRLLSRARKMARLAEAFEKSEERDAAASAIRGLIDRIVLTAEADGLHVTLKGGFGAILEWTGNGTKKGATDTPGSGMSVSMVAGEGLEPPTHGL